MKKCKINLEKEKNKQFEDHDIYDYNRIVDELACLDNLGK